MHKKGMIWMPKDIKTLKVSTAQEEATIRAYQTFGWSLVNNQEVYVKDSHLQRGVFDKKVYSVTETTHYVKLTFERDPNAVRNYRELCAYERDYYAIPAPSKKPFTFDKSMLAFLAVIALVFVCLFSLFDAGFRGFVFLLFYAALIYFIQQRGLAKLPEWNEECKEYWRKREEILSMADRLMIGSK